MVNTIKAFLLVGSLCLNSSCLTKPEVEKTEPLTLSCSVSHISLHGAADGAIDLTVTGGEKPYSFQWSTGSVSEDLFGLEPGVYSVLVTDAAAGAVSDTITVEDSNRGKVADIDGNMYNTVKIGEQWWMAEDLKVTSNPAGDPVESRIYGDDPENESKYGRLYTWYVTMNGDTQPGAQGIAPEGWHIPTVDEWCELVDFLGGEAVAGGKLKAAGTYYWADPNVGATNSSGFFGRGSGELDCRSGQYQFIGTAALYWASESTNNNPDFAPYLVLENDQAGTRFINWDKQMWYSVRCVKNVQ